jgi:hypothetical protein
MTKVHGQFSSIAGEKIAVTIDDIQFPSVVKQEVFFPLAAPLSDINDDMRVSNMFGLLQTLGEHVMLGFITIIIAQAHKQATGVNGHISASGAFGIR